MNNQSNQSWALLLANNIVSGEQPEQQTAASPWYVKVLLAFSAWLAAIFIFVFVAIGLENILRDSTMAGVVGGLMIAGAFALLRSTVNEFAEHLGLATSIAGQALVIWAIFELSQHNATVEWLLVAALQVGLVALMPNFVHRVFSTAVATIAFSMALEKMGSPNLMGGLAIFGAVFCWLNEFRQPHQMQKLRAIGYGLVLALMALKGTNLFGHRAFGYQQIQNPEFWAQAWFGELLFALVALYLVCSLLQRYGQPLQGRTAVAILLATLAICAVSVNVQGITLGMVVICLGFYSANRALLGLGIASLLFYISAYYYLLETTLLEKSLSLLAVGLTLLLLRWLMAAFLPAHKETHRV